MLTRWRTSEAVEASTDQELIPIGLIEGPPHFTSRDDPRRSRSAFRSGEGCSLVLVVREKTRRGLGVRIPSGQKRRGGFEELLRQLTLGKHHRGGGDDRGFTSAMGIRRRSGLGGTVRCKPS